MNDLICARVEVNLLHAVCFSVCFSAVEKPGLWRSELRSSPTGEIPCISVWAAALTAAWRCQTALKVCCFPANFQLMESVALGRALTLHNPSVWIPVFKCTTQSGSVELLEGCREESQACLVLANTGAAVS